MRWALALLCLTLPAAGDLAPAQGPTPASLVGAPLPAPVSDADYRAVDPDEAALGWLLFYDPILSGNRNIACATCHHPRFATSDGVSLSLGEGGIGLGPDRRPDPHNRPEQRLPRNAPALFNLGAHAFTRLFHDGRIEIDPTRPSGLRTPMGEEMLVGFATLLSAQTMFPVLSPDEMAGHYSENAIAAAARRGLITGPGGAWDLLSARVAAIPAYQAAFAATYPEIAAGRPIAFTDISNAVAAFMEEEWRSDTSPYDAHLRGVTLLAGPAAEGLVLFYGKAGCASCHAGPFLTDHAFHAMGVPQIGPGKAARFERHRRDDGRFRVTGRAPDRYRFRTPSLRNVMQTGPWGHDGAYTDMAAFLAAHADPAQAIGLYDPAQALLPPLDGTAPFAALDDAVERAAIAAAATPARHPLEPAEIASLIAFLDSLSDPIALAGRRGIPTTLPSGLSPPR
ncbi:MAG: cytochrome c peroxidase [Pseudomonadota bacterium]